VEALDGPAIRWFIQAFERDRKFSLNFVAQSVAAVLRGVGKLTGGGFLEQMAELISDLNDLFGGFRERAARVSAAFRQGDVAYVAMLHVAEKRAARLFRRMSAATRHDPETNRIFEEILKDERFHVAYTKKALETFDAVDSLDSLRLAEALERSLAGGARRLPVLIGSTRTAISSSPTPR